MVVFLFMHSSSLCCLQVRDTVDIDGCRTSYYTNLFPLNPGGIIPSGPTAADLKLDVPAGRGSGNLADVCYMQPAAAVVGGGATAAGKGPALRD